MTFEVILSALADATRRAILDRMREGPQPVGRIAETLPVTRPAVSQHLKVLVEAGLVSMTPDGRRNLYGLTPGGAGPLVDWLGDLSVRDVPAIPQGVHRSLAVRLTPAEAWQLFCEDLALWWPVAVVSMSAHAEGALPHAVVLDARPGGALREVMFDGSEGVWARVAEVVPGERLVLNWSFLVPATVVVSFRPEAGGTRLSLTHGVEDDRASELWDLVLMERFAAAAASSLSNF